MAGAFDRLWKSVSEVQFGEMHASRATANDLRKRGQGAAPVVWLLGKTGAGKTAIVAALTGSPRAEIGEGFEPCTRTATIYDVPPEVPLIRFLDTRGIGEVDYNPAEDIAWCERQSHVLLVAMQVADPMQETVLRVVKQARRRHFNWPLVVVQTGLHRLYAAGARHPEPYPYTGGPQDQTHATLPQALRQALAFQRRLFGGLPGPRPCFVPIDFTIPEDGLLPPDFGVERLWRVLEETGLSAFEALHAASADAESDQIRAKVRPLIYGYGAAAAGAGATQLCLDCWLGRSQQPSGDEQRTKLVVLLLISLSLPPAGTASNAMPGPPSSKLQTPPHHWPLRNWSPSSRGRARRWKSLRVASTPRPMRHGRNSRCQSFCC